MMIEPSYLSVLHKIHARLQESGVTWVITGSFGMALQGMDILVHDIDLQTDEQGAYEMENKLREYVVTPVRFLQSERLCSHLGKFEIDGIQVEVMGALQKRLDAQTWEEPVRVDDHRRWVELEGMQIPVFSLEYEYQAYLKLGRVEKASMLKEWIENRKIN